MPTTPLAASASSTAGPASASADRVRHFPAGVPGSGDPILGIADKPGWGWYVDGVGWQGPAPTEEIARQLLEIGAVVK